MKRKTSVLLLFVLMLAVTLVMVLGMSRNKEQQDTLSQQAEAYKNEKNTENKKNEEQIKNTWLGTSEPRVYIIGSSVAAGSGASDPSKTSWSGLLYESFKETNPDIEFSNLAVGGYSTSDILENNIVDRIKEPDVVIFETSLLNNFGKITIKESNSQIEEIYTLIREKYPEAKIILMPPNFTTDVDSTTNSEGYTFREYVKASGDFIESNEWEYIDFWNDYEQKINESGIGIKDTLSDGIHPNDVGYKLWFDSIKGYFGISE